MKLNGWVNVKQLLTRDLNTWMSDFDSASTNRPRLPWYLLSDLIRYRSSQPFMRKAVADAVLLYSRGGFGDMGPEQFRTEVLNPARDVAKDEEKERMRAARRERKRQRKERRRANSLGAREQTSGTARPARAPVTDENVDGPCDPCATSRGVP